MSNTTTFRGEHRAFAYLFCALITLCAFPVLAMHYLNTLQSFAVLAIGGLLLSDAVMWFAGHWSVKTKSGLMRSVSLVVKYVIAAAAVCIAAVVIMLMRADGQTKSLIAEQSQARVAEIQARASAAKELAGTQGGRSAAREAMKMTEGQSIASIAGQEQSRIEHILPPWFTLYGVYVILPILSILGALALSVSASIAAKREEELSIEAPAQVASPALNQSADRAPAPVAVPSPSPALVAKPRIVWRGGKQVEQARPQ